MGNLGFRALPSHFLRWLGKTIPLIGVVKGMRTITITQLSTSLGGGPSPNKVCLHLHAVRIGHTQNLLCCLHLHLHVVGSGHGGAVSPGADCATNKPHRYQRKRV